MGTQNKEIRLCVIIPTYNNAGTIRNVVENVLVHCQHVIVVNDDGNKEILLLNFLLSQKYNILS